MNNLDNCKTAEEVGAMDKQVSGKTIVNKVKTRTIHNQFFFKMSYKSPSYCGICRHTENRKYILYNKGSR